MFNFVKVIAVATATVAMAATAQADELKFAHFMSPNHPDHGNVFIPMAEQLAEATAGEVTMRIYPGGELGSGPRDQYNRAVDGITDLSFALPGYTASAFPLTLLAEMPGVLSDEATATQALWANIDHLDREFRRVELISLWTNPDAVIFTRDVPIRALDDLAGLKIRVPSRNAGMIVEAWGATPVSMPAPQMYNALQTGVIDGALIDEGGVLSFKLEEVASFMTRGMQSQISPFMIVMNRDAFADLSNAQQTALKDIGQEMSLVAQETRAASSVRGADVFAAAEGHEIIELSEAEAARFDDAAVSALEAVIAELEADGIPAAEFVSALQGE